MDKLKILQGENIVIGGISLKNPTLRDIVDLGEEEYFKLLQLFCTDPYDMMVMLDDIGIDYVDVDSYDIFLMMMSQGDIYSNVLEWFMGVKNFITCKNPENDMLCLFDKETETLIDKIIFFQIQGYMNTLNCISHTGRFNPADIVTRKRIIEHERRKLKRKKDNGFKSVFGNQISALVWGNTCGYNYSNVWDLTIYQLYDGLRRISKIKHHNNLMNGVYFGTVDLKQVNQDEIDWLSDIN